MQRVSQKRQNAKKREVIRKMQKRRKNIGACEHDSKKRKACKQGREGQYANEFAKFFHHRISLSEAYTLCYGCYFIWF